MRRIIYFIALLLGAISVQGSVSNSATYAEVVEQLGEPKISTRSGAKSVLIYDVGEFVFTNDVLESAKYYSVSDEYKLSHEERLLAAEKAKQRKAKYVEKMKSSGVYDYQIESAKELREKQKENNDQLKHGIERAIVIRVVDGDTLIVKRVENNNFHTEERIRLIYIDAPELQQPYGEIATDHLARLIAGNTVELESISKDTYGRTLANVYIDDMWINLQMVHDGYAWRYKKYCRDIRFVKAEQSAKGARRGLWRGKKEPPWEFRERYWGGK